MSSLVLALQGGCASDLPTVPGEETSSGGSGSETEDTGVEAGCGNGIVEAGETCDEQGQTATCDEDCTPVDCGDRLVNEAAGEQCDEGEATETCNLDCTLPRCGDGVINVGGEQCDDGVASAFCDADCTPAICGDEVLNTTAGEVCDDGGKSEACDVDCTPAHCGDGVFNELAGEECDDAGGTGACDVDCTLVECGDGITNATAGEPCDDGGESATCNSNCTLVACGDGITNVTAGEECDDTQASAGCDADCTVAECGDATLNALAGESCDVPELAGGTCEGLGFGVGMLACDGGCSYETSGCAPAMPVLSLSFSQVKLFDFTWAAAQGAEYYQVLESPSLGEPYLQLGGDIIGESVSIEMPLHLRREASYMLRACNGGGCTDSAEVSIMNSLAEAVGFFKASNTAAFDQFGFSVALSGDGNTLAVSAPQEDSNASGINGDQSSDSASDSGAVYVFTRSAMGAWSQQAYVKASNADSNDIFGYSVALSDDGSTLAVGAHGEDSSATGIDGNQASDTAPSSGAVYVFSRNGMGAWSQQAYVKATNIDVDDTFGRRVALSGDGNTLAVGADGEDSNATGVGGNQADDSASSAGAVYVFVRSGMAMWSQQAYIKASTIDANDLFGYSLALNGDGSTLAVGAYQEDSGATAINGNEFDDSAIDAGATYMFVRDGMNVWSQQAYVKASNAGAGDFFGLSVALSGDGNTLAVGARYEDGDATGINGSPNEYASDSGAAYVFVRDDMGLWLQLAYVKAPNTGSGDQFGSSVALSGDGNTLVVGAWYEDSSEAGIGVNQADNIATDSGAAYVLVRDDMGVWSQQAYVKASNTDSGDEFGISVALSGNGNVLAVGARYEDNNATGIGGNQADDSAPNSGAVYLY